MPDPSYTAIQLMVIGTPLAEVRLGLLREATGQPDHDRPEPSAGVGDADARERLIAAEGADQFAWLDRKAGHKIETIWPIDGAFAIGAPTVVIKGAPHPNAAKASGPSS